MPGTNYPNSQAVDLHEEQITRVRADGRIVITTVVHQGDERRPTITRIRIETPQQDSTPEREFDLHDEEWPTLSEAGQHRSRRRWRLPNYRYRRLQQPDNEAMEPFPPETTVPVYSGLSNEQISTIPSTQISPQQFNDRLTCSICFEEFKLGETTSRLPCGHYYHNICISEWLKLQNSCPTCRAVPIHVAEQRTNGDGIFDPSEMEIEAFGELDDETWNVIDDETWNLHFH